MSEPPSGLAWNRQTACAPHVPHASPPTHEGGRVRHRRRVIPEADPVINGGVWAVPCRMCALLSAPPWQTPRRSPDRRGASLSNPTTGYLHLSSRLGTYQKSVRQATFCVSWNVHMIGGSSGGSLPHKIIIIFAHPRPSRPSHCAFPHPDTPGHLHHHSPPTAHTKQVRNP